MGMEEEAVGGLAAAGVEGGGGAGSEGGASATGGLPLQHEDGLEGASPLGSSFGLVS